MLGENIRMLLDEPGGGCGSGGAKDHAQTFFFGFGNDDVKEAEIVRVFHWLHPVPGKFTDTDHVAAQLHNAVHICVHQGNIPLFRIVVNAQ